MENKLALELKGVTKSFGKVVANNNVSLDVRHGEILAILGENGSGKTTLMNMVSGIYFPDEGQIFVEGEEVVIKSPKDAFKYKIGMIHQHFKLVDVFTATENIILGVEDEKRYNIKEAKKRVKAITDKYGFSIDLDKKIYNMSVSEKQTVEIIKVLYRGADILILDEPTAVLTPQETEKLFDVLRNMRKDGKSIIIITHKLHEVLEISDRVAILRKGEHIKTVETKQATEQSLTEAMMGEKVDLNIIREEPKNVKERLDVENLTVIKRDGTKALDNVCFKAYGGEILGIAGISGCGQKELLESIAGLQQTTKKSSILYKPDDLGPQQLVGKSPREIRKLGIALSFVPEDRLGMGLVGNMDIVDNMMLRSYKGGKTAFLSRKEPKMLADDIIEKLEVSTPSASTPVRRLSGGNVQKVLVGREIALGPKVLMVAYPVRGLDINSSYTIYGLLSEQKEKGTAVIFVGEDLDVLIELCDRIMVINSGCITGIVDGKTATKEEIGLLMTKSVEREEE
ncbi:ABC transporter ATP-binding protein [uncultured Eubacterium sp.]|uniref:ABC transporter ATP-binding protein n=1 Tax=uncultured Eubacterium sp. TaxID=165185 RepID=UPI0025E655C0|nr:ABC transporter ATP-binding protein [uncultured Eubacterium sp.]MDD5837393.1 ABC transporter ATP-binding protein [Eubacteriales bacterium]